MCSISHCVVFTGLWFSMVNELDVNSYPVECVNQPDQKFRKLYHRVNSSAEGP